MSTIQVKDAAGNTVTVARIADTGQGLMAASLPVTIASDQSAVPVTASSLPLPDGAATAAAQATSNTQLAAIAASVDGLESSAATGNASLAAIAGSVDGLEAAAATGNASLAAIASSVDGLETAAATGNTSLAAIAGSVDGLEAAAATGNASLAAIAGSVDGLETAAAATNTKLDTLAGHVDGLEAATGAQDDAAAAADGSGNYSLIGAAKRALLNWAALLSRLPAALVSGRLAVASSVPHVSSGVIMSAQTQATGTNWTAFSSQACVALDIVNNTAVTIEYRRGATGTAMQIPAGGARMVIGITNANQIDVRRTDTANTQVTVQAEAFQH